MVNNSLLYNNNYSREIKIVIDTLLLYYKNIITIYYYIYYYYNYNYWHREKDGK